MKIRALSRAGRSAVDSQDWDWVKGNALNQESIVAAAEGVDAIVRAVNPQGYTNWAALVIPMIKTTIAAAKASGARILFSGTIYNYGADAFPLLPKTLPSMQQRSKGPFALSLRNGCTKQLRTVARSLIVRFGDFFAPSSGQSYFLQGMIKPNQPVTSISYLDGAFATKNSHLTVS